MLLGSEQNTQVPFDVNRNQHSQSYVFDARACELYHSYTYNIYVCVVYVCTSTCVCVSVQNQYDWGKHKWWDAELWFCKQKRGRHQPVGRHTKMCYYRIGPIHVLNAIYEQIHHEQGASAWWAYACGHSDTWTQNTMDQNSYIHMSLFSLFIYSKSVCVIFIMYSLFSRVWLSNLR